MYFLVLVLLQQRSETGPSVAAQVTAQGFYSQAKDSTSLRHEGGSRVAEGLNLSCGFLLLYIRLLIRACPMQLIYNKKGVCLFHLKFS